MQSIISCTTSLIFLICTLIFQSNRPTVSFQYQPEQLTTLHLQVAINGEYVETYAYQFLFHLEAQLKSHDVNLDWFMWDSNKPIPRPDMYILFSQNQADEQAKVRIQAWPARENLRKLSTVLMDGNQFLDWNDIPYDQFDEATTAIVLRFVTALSLYAVQSCDQAEQYFSTLQAEPQQQPLDTPNFKAALEFYRGNCALINGDFEQATRLFEISLSARSPIDQGMGATAINLAWVYVKLGRNDEAFKLMKSLITLYDPIRNFGSLEILLKKQAQLHVLAFKYDDAINDLNLLITYCLSAPGITQDYCSRYYTLRGQTYLLLYEWDKVAADYDKALELDPTYADAYFYRGVLYYSILQTGQAMYTDALADFRRYLELAPDGEHAADATRYATDIQTQINALNS